MALNSVPVQLGDRLFGPLFTVFGSQATLTLSDWVRVADNPGVPALRDIGISNTWAWIERSEAIASRAMLSAFLAPVAHGPETHPARSGLRRRLRFLRPLNSARLHSTPWASRKWRGR